MLYPLLWTVSASFSNPVSIRQGKLWLLPVGFQLQGYKLVCSDNELLTGYANSLFYMVAGTAINIFMTIIAAYPLSCREFGMRKLFTLMITLTMWFNGGIIPYYLLITETPDKLPTDSVEHKVTLDTAKAGVQAWFDRKTKPFSLQRKPDGLRNSAQSDTPKTQEQPVPDNRVPILQTDTRLEHLRY